MTGVALRYDLSEVDNVAHRIEALTTGDRGELLDVIGATVESQTRARINEQQGEPSGAPWHPWSPAYAKTRHGNQRILESEGHLEQSLTHIVADDHSSVEVGSNLVYARIQQKGGDIEILPHGRKMSFTKDPKTGQTRFAKSGTKGAIEKGVDFKAHTIHMPARPYLGLSRANEVQLEAVIADWWQERINALHS